jgi:low temperature requirement protein LtrA
MTSTQLDAIERAEEIDRHTSYLELFFDLVVVFAFTQVSTLILHDPSAAGFARAALVLGMIWWAWGGYAWMTNAIDIESTAVRLVLLVCMAAMLFMALAVPAAYHEQGLWFVAPYLVVRLLHVLLYLWGLRHEPAHFAAFLRLAPWFLVAPAIAFAGGLVDGDARTLLWGVSLAIDVGGALTLGGESDFRVSPAHFAERYALIVIIALGESIVAIGVGAADEPRDATFALAVMIAFAGAASLWWSYFDFFALGAERALRFAEPRRRGGLARDVFSILHYPIVLGIIFFAVAAKKTVAHPEDPLSGAGRAALALGIALGLSTPALARYRVVRRVAWERGVAIAAAPVAVVLFPGLAAMWLLALVIAIVVVLLAVEAARLRGVRAQIRSDGPPVPSREKPA